MSLRPMISVRKIQRDGQELRRQVELVRALLEDIAEERRQRLLKK